MKPIDGETPIMRVPTNESANKSANQLPLIHRKSPKQTENRDQIV